MVHCLDSYDLLRPDALPPALEPHDGVTVHSLRSGWKWVSPLLSQQTGLPLLKRRALERVLAGRRFDVVHFHNISLFGPAVLRLNVGDGHTLKVYSAHEYWLVCPTHSLYKYNAAPCVKPSCLACQLRAKRPPQWWRYTRLLEDCSREVDLFIAPSRFVTQLHQERGFPRPFAVLPLFSKDPPVASQAGPPVHPRPYFLFVGRLEPLKGVESLLRVWREFEDADLVLAGTGSDERRLRSMAEGNPRVRFLGRLPFQGLSPWYRQAVALVLPTATYEMFGTVIAEAVSHGTPVIARDIGGMAEVVEQSHAGLLFRTDEDLVLALRRLASSPELRREFAANALAAWRER
jgi:glycosyltransferase involved in cell wall biosynthesis